MSDNVPGEHGVPTFMGRPHTTTLDGVDADIAFVGVPWDSDVIGRSGTRHGPNAIREASRSLKSYDPITEVNVESLDIVDNGDATVLPGYTLETYEKIEEKLAYVLEHDIFPIVGGGDHAISFPIIRAVAEAHGPVSLVWFDAHSDLWPEYFDGEVKYNHGTWVHNALDEGLIDPDTSIRVGDRGPLYAEDDPELFEESGIEYYTMQEFDELGLDQIGERIRDRVDGPTYVSIDIDAVDPGSAPGTGGPWPGGFYSREILNLARELRGIDMVGVDLVEVAPPLDDNANTTATLAAFIIFETLCAAFADQ